MLDREFSRLDKVPVFGIYSNVNEVSGTEFPCTIAEKCIVVLGDVQDTFGGFFDTAKISSSDGKKTDILTPNSNKNAKTTAVRQDVAQRRSYQVQCRIMTKSPFSPTDLTMTRLPFFCLRRSPDQEIASDYCCIVLILHLLGLFWISETIELCKIVIKILF